MPRRRARGSAVYCHVYHSRVNSNARGRPHFLVRTDPREGRDGNLSRPESKPPPFGFLTVFLSRDALARHRTRATRPSSMSRASETRWEGTRRGAHDAPRHVECDRRGAEAPICAYRDRLNHRASRLANEGFSLRRARRPRPTRESSRSGSFGSETSLRFRFFSFCAFFQTGMLIREKYKLANASPSERLAFRGSRRHDWPPDRRVPIHSLFHV